MPVSGYMPRIAVNPAGFDGWDTAFWFREDRGDWRHYYRSSDGLRTFIDGYQATPSRALAKQIRRGLALAEEHPLCISAAAA